MEWLEFNKLEVERKTKVFEVRNIKTDFFLGTIEWDGAWRQYVFSPTAKPCKFSKGCLKEIFDFINELMEERKNVRKI